jgi:hypothetical protein
MKLKLEFGSKWFYIFGVVVASLLWVLLYFVNTLFLLLLLPILIVAGAYIAIVKAGIEKENWYIIGNSILVYGMAAATVNALIFLIIIGPIIWGILFQINEYISAIGGLLLISLALWLTSVGLYSLLGLIAVFIRTGFKKTT